MISELSIKKYFARVDAIDPIRSYGRVTQVIGLVIEGSGPPCSLGAVCAIYGNDGDPIEAVVVGFNAERILLMPIGVTKGISPGSMIVALGSRNNIMVNESFFGRVLDGFGRAIDGKGELVGDKLCQLFPPPLNPMARQLINKPLDLGIKSINGLLTVGKGQRMGIFAGSGVGKSVLLGMMARHTSADVNVIALIGERGREVREFLEKDLGEAGLKRSVVVVATSDQPPLIRLRGLYIAMAIAEYFRDKGKDVLLMVDSLTRFAMAQREIGLAVGEPPTTKGYTPSVFAELPRVLERAGCYGGGSITGLYTVLVEGDDMNDPIADTARSILDGHIILSRDIAMKNHYPPIDILQSISRLKNDIVEPEHLKLSRKFVELAAAYTGAEDLINIGAYKKGSSSKIDNSIEMKDKMDDFLMQEVDDCFTLDMSVRLLHELFQPRGEV